MLASLLLAGAGLVYLFLGSMHAWFTWLDSQKPQILVPRDPAVVEAMRGMPLRIHPQTDFWKTWIGFNYSHSLGIVLFAATLLAFAWAWPELFRASWAVRGACLLPAALYVLLAWKFWFIRPLQGASLSLALIFAAVVLA